MVGKRLTYYDKYSNFLQPTLNDAIVLFLTASAHLEEVWLLYLHAWSYIFDPPNDNKEECRECKGSGVRKSNALEHNAAQPHRFWGRAPFRTSAAYASLPSLRTSFHFEEIIFPLVRWEGYTNEPKVVLSVGEGTMQMAQVLTEIWCV